MLKDTKADYILKYGNIEILIYKKINKDIENKYLKLFETSSPKNIISFESNTLKEMIFYYENKKNQFATLISNKNH